ncbi:MAG: M28 family peptidase [Bacteroidota bacterium]|nr:M28 family peptidase [Bacteroidota bacterium]
MKNNIILVLILSVFLFACQNTEEDKKTETKEEKPVEVEPRVKAPDFNADSAYAYIEKQVSFGPRVPNSKAHAQTAQYLVNKLKSYEFNVILQEGKVTAFDNKVLDLKNIIAEYKPEASERIMLFAHWDTRPFADQDTKDRNKPIDGANDGGSGVGVLLEIARQISIQKPAIGIDIILFDAEDYGQPDGTMMERKADTYALGSQFWSKQPHKKGYNARYGILLDMVGAKDALFTKEGTSMYYAPMVVEKVWNTAASLGYGAYFIDKKTPGITDDHSYVNAIAGIPSIDIIQYDPETQSKFGHYWHTHDDNMEIIDKNTLKAVGQTLLEVIYQEKEQ